MSDIAFELYNLGWRLLRPLLKAQPRLKEGYAARILAEQPPGPADIWIQAASAGEAYLAISLIKNLPADRKLRILVSTNTRQGMDILSKGVNETSLRSSHADVMLTYFPFDQPAIMDRAVRLIKPGVMVLLESELWPGLLAALHRHNCRILIVNGRMTPKSVRHYSLLPKLWKSLAPDRVLAISENDGRRFARLFGQSRVEVISNIKFDGVIMDSDFAESTRRIKGILPRESGFLVLGSIRQEEEADVLRMVGAIDNRFPDLVIGLFPRHMHRLNAWQEYLTDSGKKWRFRSALTENTPALPGSIVLWDTFGDLNAAYALAGAVFVGGSLAPLGGQNFLEPLMNGVVPVIGPSWENFLWIGPEVFSAGLVRKTSDWRTAASELIKLIDAPLSREEVRRRATAYIRTRQGGTELACQRILAALDRKHS